MKTAGSNPTGSYDKADAAENFLSSYRRCVEAVISAAVTFAAAGDQYIHSQASDIHSHGIQQPYIDVYLDIVPVCRVCLPLTRKVFLFFHGRYPNPQSYRLGLLPVRPREQSDVSRSKPVLVWPPMLVCSGVLPWANADSGKTLGRLIAFAASSCAGLFLPLRHNLNSYLQLFQPLDSLLPVSSPASACHIFPLADALLRRTEKPCRGI